MRLEPLESLESLTPLESLARLPSRTPAVPAAGYARTRRDSISTGWCCRAPIDA